MPASHLLQAASGGPVSNVSGKGAPSQPDVRLQGRGQLKAISSQQELANTLASNSDPREDSSSIHYTHIVLPGDLP